MGEKENKVKMACLNTLHANKYEAWLYNNQATPIFKPMNIFGKWYQVLMGWRKNTYNRTGVADIIVILPGGRAGFIEAKQGRNKQQDNQKDFEKDVTAKGALYMVVYSVEEMVEKMAKEGYPCQS